MKTQNELTPGTHGGYGPEYNKKNPMPRTKIDAFFEEFPWLQTSLSLRISQIYVSRIEPSILEYRPMQKKHWFYEDDYEVMRFLDKEGLHLKSLHPWENKTVGEFIHCYLEEFRERVSYILSTFRYTNAAIIYKSPKGISIPKWIEKLIADEKAKIHAEVEAIDAEYVMPKLPEGPPNRVIKPREYESSGRFSNYE